jgi:hypothetical protein
VDSSIADPIVTDMAIHAVIRALNSCKKGLLLVAVEIPKTANNIRLDDLEFAKIQVGGCVPMAIRNIFRHKVF